MRGKNQPTPQFVKQELNRLNVKFQKTGNSYMMLCCFHRDNKSPSLSINIDGTKVPPGSYHCFSCHASGSWNSLAQSLGLNQWGKEKEEEVFVSKTLKEIKEEVAETGLKLSSWDSSWRRYSPEFLKMFKVRQLTDMRTGLKYMWVPLTYSGDMHGYIRVRIAKEDKGPKYFFSPKMQKVLFPGDFLLTQRTPVLVLVEGIADAFRLIKHKIAAASILGTVLLPLMQEQLTLLGVEKVIVCLDGDSAGRRATKGYKLESGKRIKGVLEVARENGVKSIDFRLPKENDPDDAPIDVIRSLWKLYRSEGGIPLEF